MKIYSVAAIWGFAEAVFFFIVPDVWLSIVGRDKLKVGLFACFYALVGALLGGVVLYVWGYNDLAGAVKFIEHIPAINNEMMMRVNAELATNGVMAVVLGPLSGTPYKVYAVQAASSGIGLWTFVLVSFPARLLRFLLVVLFTHYALKVLCRALSPKLSLAILLSGWVVFYSWYFYVMAG